MTGYRTRILSALLSTAALFAAGDALAQTPKRGGTAIYTITADPTALNPAITTNVPDRQIGCTIIQGLIDVSTDLSKILPLLAKSWTISPDGKTYSFELDKETWHDGKPFTSEDVKFSIEVDTKFSSVLAAAGNNIASIETPAPDKVVFKLKDSFGPFLTSLACQQGAAILPAHIFRDTDIKTNPATTTSPVGTGPFKVTEWKRGDYVRMARNDKYFVAGKPYLDGVVAKVVPTTSGRVQALQAGEVDYVPYFPGESVAALKANPKLQAQEGDLPPAISILFYNTKRKPFDDKRVRQALAMATDRDYLLKNAFFDIGKVGVQPFPSQIPWAANPDINYKTKYPFDYAKANALLDEAGVKRGADGKRFTSKIYIFTGQYPEFQIISQSLKSMWSNVGVDLVIESLEAAAMSQKAYIDMDFDLTLMGYTSYADPALGLARAFVSSSIGKVFANPTGWSTPEVDKLFADGARATDFADRGVFYKKAQAIIADELPMLTLREYKNVEGATVKLKGLWSRTENNGAWEDAWLDQ